MKTLNWQIPSNQSLYRRHFLHPHSPRKLLSVHPMTKPINYLNFPYTTARDTHNKNLKNLPTKIKDATLNELSELDIPGFGRIFNAKLSCLRRFFWILILIVSTFIAAHQIYSRFIIFYHVVPAVVVRYESRSTFEIPRVTLCPGSPNYNPKLQIIVKKFFNIDGWDIKYFFKLIENKSLDEIWNLTDVLNSEPKVKVAQGLSVLDKALQFHHLKFISENVHNPTGKCTRLYSLTNITYSGYYTNFNVYIPYHDKNVREVYGNNTSFTKIQFERNDFNNYSQFFILSFGTSLPLFQLVRVVLRIKELEYINVRDYPCVNALTFNKCFENCTNNYLIHSEHIPCKLPYMSSDIKIRMCKTADEFRHVYEATDRAIDRISASTCSCPRQCTQVLFEKRTIVVLPKINKSLVLNLLVLMPHDEIERITEYNSYTEAALLSDVGGSLGLYLGICVVSVLELFEVIVINVIGPLYYHLKH